MAHVPGIAAVALFAGALGLLVAAVLVVVLRVLAPQSYRNLAMSEVRRYALPEFVFAEKVMVQGRTLRGLIDALATERDRNDRKARALRTPTSCWWPASPLPPSRALFSPWTPRSYERTLRPVTVASRRDARARYAR